MTTEKLTDLENAAADAMLQALGCDDWLRLPNADKLAQIGLDAIERRQKLQAQENAAPEEATRADASDIDEQGWISDSWAAWRLVLRTGNNPAMVFFSREPTYAERKAFAAAAKIPVVDAVVEERPQQ